jgi:hypothetical protein
MNDDFGKSWAINSVGNRIRVSLFYEIRLTEGRLLIPFSGYIYVRRVWTSSKWIPWQNGQQRDNELTDQGRIRTRYDETVILTWPKQFRGPLSQFSFPKGAAAEAKIWTLTFIWRRVKNLQPSPWMCWKVVYFVEFCICTENCGVRLTLSSVDT